jgi:predicted amidohydrolase
MTVPDQIARLQAFHDDWVGLHRQLARRHAIALVAGSFPLRHADGRVTNRAWICHPDERLEFQDKLKMTRFEAEEWGVGPGSGGLRVVDFGAFQAAVAICYDAEFPLPLRAAAEAGATVFLCPSNTDTWHGYWRVRTGLAARALENQCYAAMAPMVGDAPWNPAIDVNVGRAGVFATPDSGFPADGVLALGGEEGGLTLCKLSLRRVAAVRRRGQTRNFHDW